MSVLLLALTLLALASTAQASPAPFHARKPSGDIATGLNHACGAAVDSKGDLYLSSAATSEVKVYNPAHALLTSIADTHEPCGLAVTTTGVLYVTEKATGEVVRFKPNAYPFAGTPTYGSREVIDASTKAKGIAVDRFDDRLYVAEGDRVSAYDSTGKIGIDEVQRVLLFEATGGTFKLKFGGCETGSLPYGATAAEVKTALEALSCIGAGNVSVERPKEAEFFVTFTGTLAHTDVEPLAGDASGLTGGAGKKVRIEETTKGFSGHIGEGTLTEATGVAAYAYSASGATERYLWAADAAGADHLDLFRSPDPRTLKLRRELSGSTTPDGSFGFGAAGAYLAADPGNRNSAGECKVAVVEPPQACTAGHLFLYDAKHKALDEFDASGEYLDRTAYPGFAGAEPTAVAVERSGTANDGALYVTAGSGAGAKALAFKPLTAPKREALKKASEGGLSQVLAGARAVATDSHGDLYAATSTAIHVYSPIGKELTEFPDLNKPSDLAVDSAGKVYALNKEDEAEEVVEKINEETEEVEEEVVTYKDEVVTYYEPSKYPPEAGTTYTRHNPQVAHAKEFIKEGALGFLKAIAVDPGPGPKKDHLFVADIGVTHEYDSAANGSKLLDKKFAPNVPVSGPHVSIAVDGARGIVYIGVNATPNGQIFAADEKTEEVIGHFENTGEASPSSNPMLAVAQASGHVVQFDESTDAREYDAAGSYVAGFGAFTAGLPVPTRVAVDNACALHEPEPLTGEACKAYDPANGTAYVAYDESTGGTPDVWAFAPLDYGTAPEPTPYKLEVKKTGTGSGTVTSEPAGIDCDPTCSAKYDEGTEVTLTATPDPEMKFDGWTSCDSESEGKCVVSMTKAREVGAVFEKEAAKPPRTLTINKAGTGDGTFECKTTGSFGACASSYSDGETITVKATPNAHSTFTSWAGCSSATGNECTVSSIAANTTVTATFTLIPRTLTINKAGTGDGTFECKTTGSFGACASSYSDGETITVKATPNAHSTFTSWAGCSSATGNECTVSSIAANTTVTATFTLEPSGPTNLRTLTLTKSPAGNAGTGQGSVSSKPKGIKCAATCNEAVASMYKETPVELVAKPMGETSSFVKWLNPGGACNESPSTTCTMPIAEDESVEAVFTGSSKAFSPAEALLLTKGESTGKGTVKASGLTCEAECDETTVLYQGPIGGLKPKAGKVVILKEAPAFGSKFTGWTGCTPISETECEVKMESAKEVTAEFEALPNKTLTVNKAYSTGNGSVASKPKGIKCATTCTQAVAQMPKGAPVELVAKPAIETTFVEWVGGDCNGSTNPVCTVTMNTDETTKAVFSKAGKAFLSGSEPALTLNKAGTGFGTVKASGLGCELLCTSTKVLYQGPVGGLKPKAGKVVILKATSAPGSKAVAWTGCTPLNATECEVKMEADEEVTATFDELE